MRIEKEWRQHTMGVLEPGQKVRVNGEVTEVVEHTSIGPMFFRLLLADDRSYEHVLNNDPVVETVKLSQVEETDFDELLVAYSSHDWWYEMSDDQSVFRRGTAEKNRMRQIEARVGPEVKLAALAWAKRLRSVPGVFYEHRYNIFMEELQDPCGNEEESAITEQEAYRLGNEASRTGVTACPFKDPPLKKAWRSGWYGQPTAVTV